ncbi:hypothetical protein [Paludibaculum fermentans]|uniref:Uncharacterized protein n=1 Tax=Paludibaculum fermentans TaxID=1473598 RepID=A0A7S7SLB5_PALFE|nr:hypothetical protein [Paludibaculum fermentans]QOY90082.1 hypothetical protein IRI77_09050 [Paludibaculum fermentans]
MSRICSVLCCWLLLALPAGARTGPVTCATEHGNWLEKQNLHRVSSRNRKALNLRRAAAFQQDYGDIAVMDDSDGVIASRNPFNLQGKTLEFIPLIGSSSPYGFAVRAAEYDAAAASAGQVLSGLGDDDAIAVDLPIAVPFYGTQRDRIYVHSDGNVTMEQPEAASAARSLGRLSSGPPRLAPLFDDLDPTQANCDVRVWTGSDHVVVTWRNVPEYSDYGTGARQTFQLALWTNGHITFTYQQVAANDVVTGISPGYLAGETEVVSFLNDTSTFYGATVAERFGTTLDIDIVRVAQRFYETHEDAYDYLAIFNTSGIAAAAGALAYETTVRSLRQGIGDTPVWAGDSYGSAHRLQAVLNMGPLRQYPADPYARVGSRGAITGDNTMTLIGHESGHLFLALASVRDPLNPLARPMLGTQNAHWSFNFNSEASLLEGNRIMDNGPGATNRFLTVATVQGYSPLDQYLMGFRPAAEVPSTFLVKGSQYSNSTFPQVGISIRGERQDISVDDVIAAEGQRIPDSTVAQRQFRTAFIMIVPEGSTPNAADIAQLEVYRAEFERYYPSAAGQRAFLDAKLRGMMRLSVWPAAGLVAGQAATASISIGSPASEDLSIALARSADVLEAPDTVVIPKGASSVEFRVVGLAPGVADLSAKAADGRHEDSAARVAVQASPSDVRLVKYYQEDTLLVLKVTDRNELPYLGVKVVVEGLDQDLRSDGNGWIWLTWDPAQTLTAQVDGAPSTKLVLPGTTTP